MLEAGDRKVSMRHPYMLPDVAVIDPELTLNLPKDVTAHTGLDALTQCLEPYVSNASNPLVDAVALEGVKIGARSLLRAYENGPNDLRAREDMCLCSYYGGLSLANAKLGAVHGFSGTPGWHAPHGAIRGALPHCCAINVEALEGRVTAEDPACAEKYPSGTQIAGRSRTTRVSRSRRASRRSRVKACGVPGLGFSVTEGDFDDVVAKSKESSSMKGNPVALSDEELKDMLRRAL